MAKVPDHVANVVLLGLAVQKHEKMVAALCSELAATEHCPYHTDEGCPRPLEEREAGFENSGMCFKNTRRSRFGAECWRLWAEKKVEGE